MKLTKNQQAKQQDLYTKMVDKPYVEPTRLSINAADLPDIKNWDVGKTYDINLKAKMTSKSEGGYDGKQPLRAEFQIGTEDPAEAATESGEEDD